MVLVVFWSCIEVYNLFILNNKTMILYFLYFYLLGESMALNNVDKSTSGDFSKKVMCYFKGNMDTSDTTLINLDPKSLPNECEVIVYSRFQIDKLSRLDVDDELLKSVMDLKKPVIVRLSRRDLYFEWTKVLSSNGSSADAKVLCDFAKQYKITGYLIKSITPDGFTFNKDVGKNIIIYIKQLKQCNPDLKIGITVDPTPSAVKNPCIYNFEELNGIVDFYEINTYFLNLCKPDLYNGRTPISKSKHGPKYLFGMEEAVSYLNETKINKAKLTYVVELYPANNNSTTYSSYSQVCTGQYNNLTWCVQTSENLYNKGKFIHNQKSGISVEVLDFDDIKNDCGCSSTFNGFKSIINGYTGGTLTPCQNFDVQSNSYPVK